MAPDNATFADLVTAAPTQTADGAVYTFLLRPQDTDPYYQHRSTWLLLITKPGEENSADFYNTCFFAAQSPVIEASYRFHIEAFNDNWAKEFAEGLI